LAVAVLAVKIRQLAVAILCLAPSHLLVVVGVEVQAALLLQLVALVVVVHTITRVLQGQQGKAMLEVLVKVVAD
jgi:hypothetical protein